MESEFGQKIFKILNNKDIRGINILEILKEHPLLRACYMRPLGGVDNMTLEDHTLNVLECFENNFQGKSDILLGPQYFKLLLAFHDLGKPQAILEKQFNKQHEYTTDIIKIILKEFFLPKKAMHNIIAIINGDPIGHYLNNKFKVSLDITLQEINRMTKELSVSINNLWPTLMIYYECDVAGYESLRKKVFVNDNVGQAVYFENLHGFKFKVVEEIERFEVLKQRIGLE